MQPSTHERSLLAVCTIWRATGSNSSAADRGCFSDTEADTGGGAGDTRGVCGPGSTIRVSPAAPSAISIRSFLRNHALSFAVPLAPEDGWWGWG